MIILNKMEERELIISLIDLENTSHIIEVEDKVCKIMGGRTRI